MGNTGYKSFAELELYYEDDDSYAGERKPNVVSDPDYIAPVLDTVTCAPSPRYYNTERKMSAVKNDCGREHRGSNVTLVAYPNQFVSDISVADADAKADAWLTANVQDHANRSGSCELAGDIYPPDAPLLHSTLGNYRRIDLLWTIPLDDVGVTGYQIYKKRLGDSWSLGYSLNNGSTNSIQDFDLLPQSQYFYKIRAKDAMGNWSEYSNEVSQTTGSFTGGGSGGCFVEGTLITLPDGTQETIENLALDQLLLSAEIETLIDTNDIEELYKWSCDYLAENRIISPITKIMQKVAHKTIVVNDGLLEATPSHSQLIQRDGIWKFIALEDIRIGDHLYTIDKKIIPVTTVSVNLAERKIYPLTLNPFHTYFANGILTHNFKAPI
ncbi:Hint domain-containing protein [Flavobacterium poyangense]|uniref:Hint domain-containing protein n=1 Tax=Flavobacterium poyangense TaxID=2204302 RepID=UPI0014213199|nr:DUF5977 domain-containing protein [Flavobacterium sp. JXAS1]